jgi:uncharacterized protein YprB with RNaseH-like and TPR domain
MSKPIECKKCGKLNKPGAPVCWSCGSDITPKLTPKEAIHEEIKYRHEVLHKRRVRRFWIFSFIMILITFGFVMVNSIYGVMRDVDPNDYLSSVQIYTVDDKTYIDIEIEGINMNQTSLLIQSIILSNEDNTLEISSNKANAWDVVYAYGIFRARLIISTPVTELEVYDTVKIKFSYMFFSSILPVPPDSLFFV